MNKLKQRIEFLANIAIILVAVAICVLLVKQYVLTKPAPETRQPVVGSKLELPGVDLSSSDKTLLLVLKEGCRFCTESAPFYQRIASEAARSGQVKLIAIFPHDSDKGRRYLSELGVPVIDVTQASLNSLSVSGTPTLILLKRGTISDVWVGMLAANEEAQVLSKL